MQSGDRLERRVKGKFLDHVAARSRSGPSSVGEAEVTPIASNGKTGEGNRRAFGLLMGCFGEGGACTTAMGVWEGLDVSVGRRMTAFRNESEESERPTARSNRISSKPSVGRAGDRRERNDEVQAAVRIKMGSRCSGSRKTKWTGSSFGPSRGRARGGRTAFSGSGMVR